MYLKPGPLEMNVGVSGSKLHHGLKQLQRILLKGEENTYELMLSEKLNIVLCYVTKTLIFFYPYCFCAIW